MPGYSSVESYIIIREHDNALRVRYASYSFVTETSALLSYSEDGYYQRRISLVSLSIKNRPFHFLFLE